MIKRYRRAASFSAAHSSLTTTNLSSTSRTLPSRRTSVVLPRSNSLRRLPCSYLSSDRQTPSATAHTKHLYIETGRSEDPPASPPPYSPPYLSTGLQHPGSPAASPSTVSSTDSDVSSPDSGVWGLKRRNMIWGSGREDGGSSPHHHPSPSTTSSTKHVVCYPLPPEEFSLDREPWMVVENKPPPSSQFLPYSSALLAQSQPSQDLAPSQDIPSELVWNIHPSDIPVPHLAVSSAF